MRETDIGFIAYQRGYKGCTVTLDGEPVSHVFTADEERGEVICAALTDEGGVFLRGDKVAEVKLHGVVRITPPTP